MPVLDDGAVGTAADSAPGAPQTLKSAREARGWTLDMLAAQLKVPPARLAALEEGRWRDLPDGPYARALAKTVCRSLGLDEGPVLRGLPDAGGSPLEQVNTGLNQPFRDPRSHPPAWWRSPWVWGAVAVLAVGLGVSVLMPWDEDRPGPALAAPASATEGAPLASEAAAVDRSAAEVAPAPAASTSPAVPLAGPTPSASAAPTAAVTAAPAASVVPLTAPSTATPAAPTAASGGAPLRLRARQAAWVSVVDARGQTVLSRLLVAGESLDLSAAAPVRVTLGNAPDTELSWRGQPVDVSASASQRVARLELR
jgi:cytoskeleton protein RodZ